MVRMWLCQVEGSRPLEGTSCLTGRALGSIEQAGLFLRFQGQVRYKKVHNSTKYGLLHLFPQNLSARQCSKGRKALRRRRI